MTGLRRLLDRSSLVVAPLTFAAVFMAGWELLVRLFDIKRFLLPSPSSIVTWPWATTSCASATAWR